MARVLVVDDELRMQQTMQVLLEDDGHDVLTAGSVEEAVSILESEALDVVVADIVMPRYSGLDLLARSNEVAPQTKLILITGQPTFETASEAVRSGAFDYLIKPVRRSQLCKAVANASRAREEEEVEILGRTALDQWAALELETLKDALGDALLLAGGLIEYRTPLLRYHQARVAYIAASIADALGLPQERRDALGFAALVHDVGYIHVPEEILMSERPLSVEGRRQMYHHPRAAHDLIASMRTPWPIAKIVLQHHERLDGSGYPDGLVGDQIIQDARILAVADVVEAMASERPHRQAHTLEAIREELMAQRGAKLDPEAVDVVLRRLEEDGMEYLEP